MQHEILAEHQTLFIASVSVYVISFSFRSVADLVISTVSFLGLWCLSSISSFVFCESPFFHQSTFSQFFSFGFSWNRFLETQEKRKTLTSFGVSLEIITFLVRFSELVRVMLSLKAIPLFRMVSVILPHAVKACCYAVFCIQYFRKDLEACLCCYNSKSWLICLADVVGNRKRS